MGFFNNIFNKHSYKPKSVSNKVFHKTYISITSNLNTLEKNYRKSSGKNPYENHEHFKKWYTSKYGTVDLNKIK